MHERKLFESLQRFPNILSAATRSISPEDRLWKPASGNWSIHEIVCHLADEEDFDFPVRLKLTLDLSNVAWPPVDPVGWAIERDYQSMSFDEQLQRFLAIRAESLAWLASLDNPSWEHAYQHPKLGPVRAGDLLAAWAAHDWLHLRQISKRCFEMIERDGLPFVTAYAGEWGA